MHLDYPDSEQFKEFKRLITENTVDKENQAYDKLFMDEMIAENKSVFETDAYVNWTKYNMNNLKYAYFEDLMKYDWMGTFPLFIYCMKVYVVYLHNRKMEQLEDNVKDEIDDLVKP